MSKCAEGKGSHLEKDWRNFGRTRQKTERRISNGTAKKMSLSL